MTQANNVAIESSQINSSGVLQPAGGGTGASSLTANNVLLGNDTSAVQTVAPGTSGNILTSNGTTWTSAAAPAGVITGGLLMWPTATAPTGYLLCAGAAVSRTTYSALFAIVGTTFGAGDGSTTFNLPNYQNRMPIGAGSSYAAAATGGSADAIVVSHTHTATSSVTDPGHLHTSPVTGPDVRGGGPYNITANYGLGTTNTSSATTGITVSTTNTSTGASGTNANLPPYLAIYFIIKT